MNIIHEVASLTSDNLLLPPLSYSTELHSNQVSTYFNFNNSRVACTCMTPLNGTSFELTLVPEVFSFFISQLNVSLLFRFTSREKKETLCDRDI